MRWRASSCLLWGVLVASGRAKHRPAGRGGSGCIFLLAPRPRFPVHGFPVPGVLCRSATCPNPAPDRATLNPVYFLLYVYFWNTEYLDSQKVIFWTFTGLVEYAGRMEKARAASFCSTTPFQLLQKKSHCNDYQNNQRFQLADTTMVGRCIGFLPEHYPGSIRLP